MAGLCISLIIILMAVVIGFFVLWYKYSKLVEKLGKFKEVVHNVEKHEARLNTAAAELLELDMLTKAKTKEKEKLDADIAIATIEHQAAKELVEKEFELERIRRSESFKQQLREEFENLSANSPKVALEAELQIINMQIEEARQTLLVQQKQAQEAAEQEDFIDYHSISLTLQDQQDIALIREFSPKLTRQEAFNKLIWTEFIQKPIQSLCKILGAEKMRGIYKITNVKNQRMYIGQAVDIATRWKEHCKAGLGIGSTSYLTNKFYKALHNEGIENFTFEILEIGDINLNERETYWIDFYNAVSFGYNSKIGG